VSAHLSDHAIAAILGYLRDEIGFASFARDLSAHIDQLAAENARLSHGLQYLYDTIGREMERIHALLKTPGDKPHLFTVWTHLNSMHNQARAALSPAPAKKENERG
jgi:hypothetical protein